MVSTPNPRRPAAAAGGGETRKLNVSAPDAAPIALYRQSLDHLKGGRHADAAAGFREFLRRYAQHDYADNAQYWLAECYYDLKDFVTAVSEFRKVVEGYPQGNKVADALLKVGLAYLSLGNEPAGRSTLKELVRSYPAHPATPVASEKLSELDGKPEDAAYAGAQGR
jgi:tol-pal system protein YbgF